MVSNQLKLTSANFVQSEGQDLIPEAVLDAADPIHQIQQLAGIGNQANLNEYTGYNSIPKTEGSNCSITAMEKVNYQQQNNVQPGTPEWFRLWFSKPYLTGESPF